MESTGRIVHTGFLSYEMLPMNNPNDFTLDAIHTMYYNLCKVDIRAAIQKECEHIDLDTFEGGIDSWFGWGSVLMYELAFGLQINLSNSGGLTVSLISYY